MLMDLFIYLFLLEVAKKQETNFKGLTILNKKQKNKKTKKQKKTLMQIY